MKDRQRLREIFIWTTAAVGAAACAWAAAHLDASALDFPFLLLVACTLGIGSRLGIRIPRVSGAVTVADTFIFLTLLLYGGDAAVLLAAAEGLFTSARVNRRLSTHLCNAGTMAISVFLASRALVFCFGGVTALVRGGYSSRYLGALTLLAFVHYAVNSTITAVGQALKLGESVWRTWRSGYLWSSLTFFAGAFAAGVIARAVGVVGVYAVLGVLPVVAVIYVTYLTYLRNIESSQERADEAQRHVEELSRYIAEQERIREQFSHVEKMSALGVLASGVAHNLNNTLAAILGRAELMLLQTADPKTRRGLEIIATSARDGAQTVRRIQDFARQRSDHDFQAVRVDHLLLDVSEITRPRWKDAAEAADVQINLALCNDSRAVVRGDSAELRDVLVNMIFNAVDAMPRGGDLRLAALARDGWVVVSVSDTGAGMSPEVRAKVFDPFFTTKGLSGMGLGLAVSYGVVSRHGGSIEVESEVGRGTTFRIRLPAVVTADEDVREACAARRNETWREKMAKILVVDDEKHVRQLLCEILEESGCETAQAASGREALARFESERFDAVFTDIGMPGMSGWELARNLRERDARVPVAVITGWGETFSSSQKEAAQVDWLISKPFAMAQITQIALEVSARRSSSKELRNESEVEAACAC